MDSSQQQQTKNIKIELNGFKIDNHIIELSKEKQIAFSFYENLIKEKQDIGLVYGFIKTINLIDKKLTKWNELKLMYDLNIKVNIFGEDGVTLFELQEQKNHYEKLSKSLIVVLESISSGDNKIYDLPTVFKEHRKWHRIMCHYDEAIKMAKAQKILYEIDSKYLED